MQGGAPNTLALRRPVPVTPAQVMPVFPDCQISFAIRALLVASVSAAFASVRAFLRIRPGGAAPD